MKKVDTRKLVILSLLVAIEIVLSRFLSISAWNMKIGLSFVPIVIAGLMYGPLAAGCAAALADFVGSVLFPVGAYFPGFTLTAFLAGLVFGLLHRKRNTLRVLSVILVRQLALSLLLNTLWISVLYGSPYGPLLVTRLVSCLINGAVQFVVTELIVKSYTRIGRVAAA